MIDLTTRLDRAKANFDRFDAELSGFMNLPTSPYRAYPEIHRGGRGVVRMKIEPHPDWTLLVADIVTELRSVLDYLAFQLVVRHTGQNPPPDPESIEFPIFRDRDLFFERSKKGQPTKRSGLGKIRNMKPAAQQFISNVQPYKVSPGHPDDAGLWVLHDLCNVYKHRLLSPALLALSQLKLAFQVTGDVSIQDVVGFQLGGQKLKNGTPLATFRVIAGPNAKGAVVNVTTEPFAQICFAPGSPAERISVHDILNGSVGTVDWIVNELVRIGDLSQG